MIQRREVMCAACRAEYDARSNAEAWQYAEKVMETLSALLTQVGSPEEQEAIEDAVTRARVSAAYYSLFRLLPAIG
ncbi:MAG: hypothetical protein M3N10_02970 [Actinomycetota bacterium]|nr:hypothetical protein [Actinomycetota bacterium]